MEKLDNFKIFVKNNPILLKYIKNEEMTWQKFYEMYDMYGENNEIWNTYISNDVKKTAEAVVAGASLKDFFQLFKGMNLDSVQEGIQNVQRVVGMLGDLTNKNTTTQEYKPRPLYKHFDD